MNRYYEVRENGDGEFAYFVIPSYTDGEDNYDPMDLDSATKFCQCNPGTWVVEIVENKIAECFK